jgi:hypothetical protein
MKTLNVSLILSILIAFSSCSPRISTSLSKSYPPLDYKQEVFVFGVNDDAPSHSEVLGQVKVGDSGFSTKCNYEVVMDQAKLEARKVGGNAIKIIKHKKPNLWSTCHRITAQILKLEYAAEFQAKEEEEILLDVDYAILNVYRHGGAGALVGYDLFLGDSVICRVKNNFHTTLHIEKDGLNTLWAKTEAKAEVPIDVKLGKTYYLRCGIGMGAFVGRPKLELVDRKTGKAEFESFKTKNQ